MCHQQLVQPTPGLLIPPPCRTVGDYQQKVQSVCGPCTPSSQMRSVSCMGSPDPIDSSPPHTAHLFGSEVKEDKVWFLPVETQAESRRLAPHLRSSGWLWLFHGKAQKSCFLAWRAPQDLSKCSPFSVETLSVLNCHQHSRGHQEPSVSALKKFHIKMLGRNDRLASYTVVLAPHSQRQTSGHSDVCQLDATCTDPCRDPSPQGKHQCLQNHGEYMSLPKNTPILDFQCVAVGLAQKAWEGHWSCQK